MRISAEARTIAELLAAERRFMLPYFQRGYAWLEEHAERLFDDLSAVAEGRRTEGPDTGRLLTWYPLGNIIVSSGGGSGDAWLADGHQRLITLTILIALLRDKEEKDAELRRRLDACIFLGGGDVARPRLVTQIDAREFLADYVQNPGASLKEFTGDLAACSDSEINIVNNRKVLRARVEKLADEARGELARFILDDCMIVENVVETEAIARTLFSTMHGTGLKPTTVDLFKADVLGSISNDERETAQNAWEGAEARLGRESLNELMEKIAILEKRELPKQPVADILKTACKLDTHDGALDFVMRRLDPLGEHYADIIDAANGRGQLSPAVMRRVQYLGWVRGHDTWMVPALCWLDTHGSQGDAAIEFFRRFEALVWAEVITTQGPARRDARYMRMIDEIKADRILKPGSSLDIDAAQRAGMRDILEGPNFTRRRYKQFLLMRCDSALVGDDAVQVPSRATVEHIYPANPPAQSRWLRDFRVSGASALRQTLGNLTLLTTAEQNEAANKDFAEKRKVYGASAFAMSRNLVHHNAWLPQHITERTKGLVDLLMRSWGLV